MSNPVEILIIADIHADTSGGASSGETRRTREALALLETALRRMREERPIAAVAVLGDCVDNAAADAAERDMRAVVAAVAATGIPAVFVRGNHDLPPDRFRAACGASAAPLVIQGIALYPFHDTVRPDNTCVREPAETARFERFCADHPGHAVVALQHYIPHPDLDVGYPMNIANAGEVMDSYRRRSVAVSLSGHNHPGIGPAAIGPTLHYTAPALAERPFRFAVLRLGAHPSVEEEALDPRMPLTDVHSHTEFAYCAAGITAADAVGRAALLGLERVILTEHSTQLYVEPEDFWRARFLDDASVIRRRRERGEDRVAAFAAAAGALRSPSVALGLEVESDRHGVLTILDEDRAVPDILLGAVHFLPRETAEAGGAALDAAYLRFCGHLLAGGIDILAHPFRFFRRAGLPAPRRLYTELAAMLAEAGVAAELNFHTNEPDPRFFEECLSRGVRIATGTDAHRLSEAGDLSRHARFLRTELGLADPSPFLFRFPAGRRAGKRAQEPAGIDGRTP